MIREAASFANYVLLQDDGRLETLLTASFTVGDSALFYPGQSKTLVEELDAYTKVNAFGGFEEDYKGTLTPGKLADITIIDRNPLTSTPPEIRDTKVLYTIIGGEIKYQAQ